jgi:hypothetical protein
MAWPTLVQGTGTKFAANTTAAAVTFASTTTSGNVAFCFVVTYPATVLTTPVITDTYSNTWNLAGMTKLTASGGCEVWMFWANNITGGASHIVTATIATGTYPSVAIGEFSGAANIHCTGFKVGRGTGTSAVTASNVIAASTDLLIGAGLSETFTYTLAVGSGFTTIYTATGDGSHIGIMSEFQTGLGSNTALAWTLGTSGAYAGVSAVFSPVPSSGGGLLRNPGMSGGMS